MKRVLTDYRRSYLKLKIVEARRRLKERAVEYKGGKCEDCGFKGRSVGYDFHHTDPSKKDFTISSGDYRSFERIKPELDKTVLLCAICHRVRHDDEDLARHEAKKTLLAETAPKKGGARKAGARVC